MKGPEAGTGWTAGATLLAPITWGTSYVTITELLPAGRPLLVAAMRVVPGVILPFPGGVVRAGSKVGAKKYKNMIASTNDAYCPTLRGRPGVNSQVPERANSVLEIVVDGLDRPAIASALRAGLEAACRPGVVEISAGNYGGKLGKHHFRLHELLQQ